MNINGKVFGKELSIELDSGHSNEPGDAVCVICKRKQPCCATTMAVLGITQEGVPVDLDSELAKRVTSLIERTKGYNQPICGDKATDCYDVFLNNLEKSLGAQARTKPSRSH